MEVGAGVRNWGISERMTLLLSSVKRLQAGIRHLSAIQNVQKPPAPFDHPHDAKPGASYSKIKLPAPVRNRSGQIGDSLFASLDSIALLLSSVKPRPAHCRGFLAGSAARHSHSKR